MRPRGELQVLSILLMSNKNQGGLLRRLLGKLALVLFGLVFGLVIGEVVLRIAGYSYPEFYQPDAVRGYALRPHMQGWYHKEGRAYVNINSDGLRDIEHSIAKPPGTIRIAVIGDSYPEAFQVALEEAFWSLMKKKMEQCRAFGDHTLEVINFGVSGYGTAQEMLTLRERVWQYSPDIVMLTFTTNNDVSDNLRQLKRTDQIPYFVETEGRLVLDDSFKDSRAFLWRVSAINRLGRWIRDHSRVVQAINEGHHGFKIWLAARRARNATAAPAPDPSPIPNTQTNNVSPSAEDIGIDNVIYREPKDQVWQDAWQVTEHLLLQMRADVQAKGAKFVIVTLSNGIQVYPDSAARQNFLRRVGADNLFYPDERISQLGEREGMTVFTLAHDMQAYADQNKVFLHGFGSNQGNGHWNQLGHRVAADLIAQKFCEVSAK